MNQEDLKAMFRSQELQRRAVRRQVLLNQAALDAKEDLNSEDLLAQERAIESLRYAAKAYDDVIRPPVGYFRRLYLALLGRAP